MPGASWRAPLGARGAVRSLVPGRALASRRGCPPQPCFSPPPWPSSPEAPKVEVYSRRHANPGEENVLNCFVSGFHPPKIEILLLKNGEPMSNVQYADMSFNDKWYFQRLVYADFTPKKGDVYSCRVAHSAFREPQFFRWGIVCLPLQALPLFVCRSQSSLIYIHSVPVPLLRKWGAIIGWILKVLCYRWKVNLA